MIHHKKLLILGAGGHGRVVADIAQRMGVYAVIAFLDDAPQNLKPPFLYLGTCDSASEFIGQYELFVAIGNSSVRQEMMEKLAAQGARFAKIIDPTAVIGADVAIGAGTVVMPGVVINTGTAIGEGVIINTASSIDHDCELKSFVHIAVGAHLCGSVVLEHLVWIGAGATVINNISVCARCTIGAGAVVVKDITEPGVYIGVPAKKRKEIS